MMEISITEKGGVVNLKKDFLEWVEDKVSFIMKERRPALSDEAYDSGGEEVHIEMMVTEYFQGVLAEAKSHDYKPDPRSTRREELPCGWEIPPYAFFIEHEGRTPSSVCLVGEAGSGKSTAMKRYIAGHPDNFHFVLCSPFAGSSRRAEPRSTIFDFFFPDKSGCAEDVLREGFRWMLKNPRSITFHLDALDTLPFASEFSSEDIVSDESLHAENMESYYTPKQIIGGIMAGCFFRGCRLVLSSRHSAVTKLPEQFRPKRMISLVGLTDDSIEKFTTSCLGDSDGARFCDQIKMEHPNLWLVLAVPLFLVFSLIIYHTLGRLPSSMSDVLVNLLKLLQVTKHGVNLSQVIKKLKKLSYNGILQCEVAFNENDLENAEITPAEATSLSIFIPWRNCNLPGTESMRNLLFFRHQCIQEIFCALYVVEMGIEDFLGFLKAHFKDGRFSVVRRFIVGILLNKNVLEIAKSGNLISDPSDLELKKKALLKFLREELTRDKNPQETLDILVTASEAGQEAKEAIKEGLKSIDISGIASLCRPSDMHAMGSTIKYCSSLAELDISNCDLNPAKMEAFYRGLTSPPTNGKVKIQKFRLRRSTQLEESGVRFLAKSLEVLEPGKITLDRSKISANQLFALKEELDVETLNAKMGKLHLKEIYDDGVETTDDMLLAVCQLIPHIPNVNIRGWRLGGDHVAKIKEKLKKNKEVVVKIGDKDKSEAITAERFEDYILELIRQFRIRDIRQFAISSRGLGLTAVELDDIRENCPSDVAKEKKCILEYWYGKQVTKGKEETAVRDLRKIVREYYEPTGDAQ